MFGRAADRSSAFKNYAEAFGTALESGSTYIGRARSELLAKADEIDSGPLNVTDQWVVMIDPAGMSAEKAAELQKEAEAEWDVGRQRDVWAMKTSIATAFLYIFSGRSVRSASCGHSCS